ncbi:MAG: hypothetical protein LBP37_07725 [Spirochaetaceae bacterium]|jgi:hypothetical protein|nr:hypothetical protein [Spirochaetaceae bacterium]
MWQNIKSIIAFLCILVYIGAAAFAGRNIYKAVNEQRFEARQELADLTDFASRAGALGLFTDKYIEDIKTRLDMSKSIDALIIYGPDSNKFAFEKKSGLISYKNDYPDFNKALRLYSAPQTLPVRTEGNLNVSISALSPLIDFNTLLRLLRLSLLAILIAVVISFATLIIDVSLAVDGGFNAEKDAPVERASPHEPDAEPGNVSEPEYGAAAVSRDEELFDIDIEPPDDESAVPLEIIEPADESDTPALAEVDEPADESEAAAQAEADWPADETEAAALTEVDEPADESEAGLSENKGLLAAASTLHEEDSFDENDEEPGFLNVLQGALRRAEKSGGDLSLLDIEWSSPDLPCDSLVKYASAFFKHGSRFFEKEKQDGIYIIVPDSGLDEVFTKTKEFHRRARDEKRSMVNAELLIGLSARSGRKVDAMNLLNEAGRALAKARADTALPIVAFKADPQKYKEFIDKKRKTA